MNGLGNSVLAFSTRGSGSALGVRQQPSGRVETTRAPGTSTSTSTGTNTNTNTGDASVSDLGARDAQKLFDYPTFRRFR
jgi:hypothetical protein